MSLNLIKEAVIESNEIVIVSHEFPDGDSVGSSIALAKALSQMGKSIKIIINGDIPLEYRFLAGIDDIRKPDEVVINSESTMVFLDCADEKRAGTQMDFYRKNCRLSINIDHHPGNSNFADINHVDVSASSTGEIVYDLIKLLDITIDKDIANALYITIVTDTGSFRFDNTTAKTFIMAGYLITRDLDFSAIRINLWENKSPNSIGLLVDVLSTMKFVCNNKAAYIVATREVMEKWQVGYGELESFVNYPKSIKGIEVAILFKEIGINEIKVSFRAKADVDVQAIASYFGGGGHKKASGCTLSTQLNEGIKNIIEYLQERLI
ncbi:DHH family phosphoesterase [Desulfitibacter alkalitolerans]|uniref:DHH family phosphoesterase n=1 Tax=Desulfitibacter alkalitolerans TaxID=264641 RepID=UPI00068585BE|nr:bifunctional oligoribonuclease/PAP phosphatase NrnA [Desulfitibacter alkalitolerans]